MPDCISSRVAAAGGGARPRLGISPSTQEESQCARSRPSSRVRRRGAGPRAVGPSGRATPSGPAPTSSPWRPASSPTRATPVRRINEIADKTSTTKRMIYYYFGGKERLYIAVLEAGVQPDPGPRAAARRRAPRPRRGDPRARRPHVRPPRDRIPTSSAWSASRTSTAPSTIARSTVLSGLANPALDVLGTILRRGWDAGVFRDDVDALDVHQVISAFCVFRTANRHTFGAIFGRDLPRRRPSRAPAPDARRPARRVPHRALTPRRRRPRPRQLSGHAMRRDPRPLRRRSDAARLLTR